ncbi:hypothetical protein IMSHALPRED_007391 [Imshaugia aleurites]|uniref:Acyltransferase 3 domain-containing protein n=1 Tax=Imshaugia aleurites TaxID=172621 RepID=A0A8H3FLD3_9LECA|nr:hypothetical protein IMSHALPRED_007391 [Imshaugia aleurites]
MRGFSSHSPSEQGYLLGLRGFLVIQSFLWVFLQTLVPVAVKDSANVSGPTYEKMLRRTLSVLFWNKSLIYSSFIFLSARTICIPYLQNPGKTAVASAVFRRGLRLWFPTAVALAVAKILSATLGTAYIDQYKQETGNVSFDVPYTLPNALAYFNSVFNLFWTNNRFFEQAGNTAFPTQTLWIVSVIYSQSYTVYLTMVIIPYTRNSWRVKAYIGFIISAWWVQSWAWYSITGLLLADAVTNMRYRESAKHGLKIWRSIRCPIWIPCILLMVAGLVMQFLWTDWRPRYENKELLAHTGLYYSGGLNTRFNANEPQARDDDYLLLLGFYLLLEWSDLLRKVFETPLLAYLGRRSLSWFFVQSLIIYTVGIKLYMNLSMQKSFSVRASRSICLVVCVATTVLGAEVFHRLVEYPSQVFARVFFDWIRE